MDLKQNCKYALVVPTSIGVRITPVNRQPAQGSSMFSMQTTSAETNAASVASYLGMPVKVLTKFVKDSPVASFIKRDLQSRGMMYEGQEVEQGGPWGHRHQINIADSGYGVRGPRVHNDRAGEVGRLISAGDFDLDRIFCQEGAQILHLSGLFAALSPGTGEFCVELVEIAKRSGTKICFDLNYRESFWKGREDELRGIFGKVSGAADILVGNEEDFQLCLGVKGPETGGKGVSHKVENYKEMINRVKEAYPGTSVFATTLRQVLSADRHMWGAILHSGGDWFVEEPREIQVLDRIGGGDGFVGGMLYAVLKGWEAEEWLRFGWANGALVTTMLVDYSQPMTEDQIWDVWHGNARVKR
ncbi:MAG: sugar kinase [Clostridiales bacterium]|nr:sugar kinase [Clostridiales bacterium]